MIKLYVNIQEVGLYNDIVNKTIRLCIKILKDFSFSYYWSNCEIIIKIHNNLNKLVETLSKVQFKKNNLQ